MFREHNLQRLQGKQEELTEEEEMKQQQRMVVMKDLIRKIRSKGKWTLRIDGGFLSLWRQIVKKAWMHTGWEDTMQKWYNWLEDVKKKDEKKKMEEMHQHKVEQVIKSAEGSAGLLHRITKPTPWRAGGQDDARLLDRCEVKRKEWSAHWQCDEDVQNVQDKQWRNEELRRSEEALPRLKEGDLERHQESTKQKQV